MKKKVNKKYGSCRNPRKGYEIYDVINSRSSMVIQLLNNLGNVRHSQKISDEEQRV